MHGKYKLERTINSGRIHNRKSDRRSSRVLNRIVYYLVEQVIALPRGPSCSCFVGSSSGRAVEWQWSRGREHMVSCEAGDKKPRVGVSWVRRDGGSERHTRRRPHRGPPRKEPGARGAPRPPAGPSDREYCNHCLNGPRSAGGSEPLKECA
ncbi:hypothetical protein TcasGA2_TC033560 [Tribolium castaneum]|uniref:Uncharacterized protein n=1 Tax=Tribolium castaneum TaxID=7070 RepID=A0A139WFU3_TRICA|nr:hypothetical protein TcasGA2_TC033560 [Tribolium castaneum]